MDDATELKAEVDRLNAALLAHEWFARAMIEAMPTEQKKKLRAVLSGYVDDTSSGSMLKRLPALHAELKSMFDSLEIALEIP